MAPKCFSGTVKPFLCKCQYSSSRRLYISSPNQFQMWFRFDLKLIQIWISKSDLNQFWLRSESVLNEIWITFETDSDLKCTTIFLQNTDIYREMASRFPGKTSVPSNYMPEKSYSWKCVKVVFAILGFQARCIRSFGALLDLELQENDNIIFWKNLNKGSIWSPFPRTWLLGARFRCHGSVSRKPGSHFPVIDNTLQHEGGTFQVWVKTNSGLIQNWFWSDSKLIEIWFKTYSDLI